MGMPRLTIAVALLVLVALAATMTYTGFLVVGVLADYLDTSRFVAGLLLGAVFARFPWISGGRPRIVGLLPKPLRRPLMMTLLALCLLRFLAQGDIAPALVTGFTMSFVLALPLLKKALFARTAASVMHFGAGRQAPPVRDDSVIDGEFREMKD